MDVSKHMDVSVPAAGVILLYSAAILGYICFQPTAMFECNQCDNINMELLPFFSWVTFINYALSILLIVAYLAQGDTMWLLASTTCLALGIVIHATFAFLLTHIQSNSRDPIKLSTLFGHLLGSIAVSVMCFICLYFSKQAREKIHRH